MHIFELQLQQSPGAAHSSVRIQCSPDVFTAYLRTFYDIYSIKSSHTLPLSCMWTSKGHQVASRTAVAHQRQIHMLDPAERSWPA